VKVKAAALGVHTHIGAEITMNIYISMQPLKS
jgi:hypothetical protein